MRAGHEAKHRSVWVGDVQRKAEISAVMDLAVLYAERDATINNTGHVLQRPEHERAHIEAAQVRSASAVFALTQADHETCLVIGEDDTPHCAVLEELVRQFEVKEVGVPPGADRQVGDGELDLADTDNGEFHKP